MHSVFSKTAEKASPNNFFYLLLGNWNKDSP